MFKRKRYDHLIDVGVLLWVKTRIGFEKRRYTLSRLFITPRGQTIL